MTLEEYLDFLDEYWDLFGPIPAPTSKILHPLILL
jgi:hypothetical protein